MLFIALRLDVEDKRRMRGLEHQISLQDFSISVHMAVFGRNFWCAYNDPKEMHEIANTKLIHWLAKPSI